MVCFNFNLIPPWPWFCWIDEVPFVIVGAESVQCRDSVHCGPGHCQHCQREMAALQAVVRTSWRCTRCARHAHRSPSGRVDKRLEQKYTSTEVTQTLVCPAVLIFGTWPIH